MAAAPSERRRPASRAGSRQSKGRISAIAVAGSDRSDEIAICRYLDKVLESRRSSSFGRFDRIDPSLPADAS
jgi:hypothetical protein